MCCIKIGSNLVYFFFLIFFSPRLSLSQAGTWPTVQYRLFVRPFKETLKFLFTLCSVSWSSNSSVVQNCGVWLYLSSHLPCLCARGSEVSDLGTILFIFIHPQIPPSDLSPPFTGSSSHVHHCVWCEMLQRWPVSPLPLSFRFVLLCFSGDQKHAQRAADGHQTRGGDGDVWRWHGGRPRQQGLGGLEYVFNIHAAALVSGCTDYPIVSEMWN